MASSTVEKEAAFGFLPSMRQDRTYGIVDYTLTQIGFGIAAWSFLVGGWTGLSVKAGTSIWVILLGNALPVFLMLPLARHGGRLGLDTFLTAVTALGHAGAKVFFIIFAVLNLGYTAIVMFMLGESGTVLVEKSGGPAFLQSRQLGAPMFALIVFAVCIFIAYKGPDVIQVFTRVGVSAICLILVGLIIGVLVKYGPGHIFAAQPAEPFEDYRTGVMSAFEWNLGIGFSWLPYIGQWVRLSKTERGAVHGTFLGWGLLLNIAAIFGVFATLAIGFGDPITWILDLGGPWLGVVGILMLMLANTTTCVVLVYTQGLSFKTQFPRLRWGLAVLTIVPAGVLMISPTFYDAFGPFMAYVSFVMSVIAGVLVADYFLRRGRVEVGALYDRGNPHYRYPFGVNPGAVLAIAAGTVVYWLAFNPVTSAAGLPWFRVVGAGLPSFFVAALVYAAAMATVFKRYRALDFEWRRRLAAGDVRAVMLPSGLSATESVQS
ncbi:MAG: cytosine permease [Actinobacteria bacterium]|nr:cytosine permease [Actinomycetota bacterium]